MEKDQRDLLLEFNEQSVRYLVVVGYALGRYTEPRVTKDLDVFIEISEENAEKVFAALAKFGAPLQGLTPADFKTHTPAFSLAPRPTRSISSSLSAQFHSTMPGGIVFPA